MIEKIIQTAIDLLKFLFTTSPGWVIIFSSMLLSWFITGYFNPYYLLKVFYYKLFIWK